MSYYIDPYKKYYESLSQTKTMSSVVASSIEKLLESGNCLSKLNNSITNSKWTELGIKELSTNVIPSLKVNHDTLSDNITGVISPAVNKAINELLPEVTKLKEEDEKYDNYQKELNSLVVVPQYNSDGNVNPNYSSYISRKNDLENKIKESKTKCEEYTRNANTIVNAIKALDSKVTDFSVSDFSGGSSSVIGSVEGGKMLKMNIDGQEFYVANTRINLLDYQEYINKYNITQNGGVLVGECPVFSQYYAMDLMRGTYTARDDVIHNNKAPSPRVNVTVESTNKDDVLKYIYDEAVNGRVTTLQVTKAGGGRHIVTIVGFDSSVKSWEDLNSDTILCLDNTTGRVSSLSKSGKEGRDLLAMKSSKTGEICYMAHGATQEFLDKEVNNAKWQAKYGQGDTTVA